MNNINAQEKSDWQFVTINTCFYLHNNKLWKSESAVKTQDRYHLMNWNGSFFTHVNRLFYFILVSCLVDVEQILHLQLILFEAGIFSFWFKNWFSHTNLQFNPLLHNSLLFRITFNQTKINSTKINFIKINFHHRTTKHKLRSCIRDSNIKLMSLVIK